MQKNIRAFVIIATILALDIATKAWALRSLSPGWTVEGLGGLVPITLTFNTGVAFGISVGEMRWVIVGATFIVMGALITLFRQAREGDTLRICAIAAVFAGALGNLIDRLRWERGVVDFIGPFNLGFTHFPIFNVADMAITIGAALLAISLWMEDRAAKAAKVAPAVDTAGGQE